MFSILVNLYYVDVNILIIIIKVEKKRIAKKDMKKKGETKIKTESGKLINTFEYLFEFFLQILFNLKGTHLNTY